MTPLSKADVRRHERVYLCKVHLFISLDIFWTVSSPFNPFTPTVSCHTESCPSHIWYISRIYQWKIYPLFSNPFVLLGGTLIHDFFRGFRYFSGSRGDVKFYIFTIVLTLAKTFLFYFMPWNIFDAIICSLPSRIYLYFKCIDPFLMYRAGSILVGHLIC